MKRHQAADTANWRIRTRHFGGMLTLAALVLTSAGCGSDGRSTMALGLESGEAESTLKKNLSSSQQADVYLSLGRSAEKQGNLQEAVRMYETVIAKLPSAGEAHWRLAVTLDKSGNFDKSAPHYAEAIKHLPGSPDIYCDYGYSLALQKRWQEAETQLKQAIAIDPSFARARNNLGIVLAQGGNLDAARDAFRRGGLSLADARWNVGQSLIAQSRWDEAREEFRQILAMTPNDTIVAAELQKLEGMVARLDHRQKTSAAADAELMRASAPVKRSQP